MSLYYNCDYCGVKRRKYDFYIIMKLSDVNEPNVVCEPCLRRMEAVLRD